MMRDKIAEVIMANRAVDNWQGPRPADFDAADAIIEALPCMIEPLVWKQGETLHETYVVHLDGRRYRVEWEFYGWASTYYVSGQLQPVDLGQRHLTLESAEAAANAHHAAQVMAAFGVVL
jgi:hypothetical protein